MSSNPEVIILLFTGKNNKNYIVSTRWLQSHWFCDWFYSQ